MVKILLICKLGISALRVEEKMQAFAKNCRLDLKLTTIGESEKISNFSDYDIILLAPQIRHLDGEIKALANKNQLVKIIDSQNYGLLRGDLILKDALETFGILSY